MSWKNLGKGCGSNGGDGDNQVSQIDTLVPMGNTEIVDTFPISSICSAVWFITVTDAATLSGFRQVVGFNSGGTASHLVPIRSTKDVKFNVNVDINAGNMRLLIQNNHTADFTAKVVRIETRT